LKVIDCSCFPFLSPHLQTCSHVLLPATDRQVFLDMLKRPTLSSLARKGIAKKINEKWKKTATCPYCGATNGLCV